jgi:hypothetical protein
VIKVFWKVLVVRMCWETLMLAWGTFLVVLSKSEVTQRTVLERE